MKTRILNSLQYHKYRHCNINQNKFNSIFFLNCASLGIDNSLYKCTKPKDLIQLLINLQQV